MTAGVRSLRRARPADRPFLRDLAARTFSHLGQYDRMIPEWVEGPGASAFIALEDGRAVGFAVTSLAVLPPGSDPGAPNRG